MVSTDADAEALGRAEAGGTDVDAPGEPDPPDVGDGAMVGAGVASGTLLSTEGTAVDGAEGTGPRPPDVAHALRIRVRTSNSDRRWADRGRVVGMGRLQVWVSARSVDLSGHGRIART